LSRVEVAAKRQGDLYSSIRVVAWELCVCLCRNWRMAAVVVCHSSSSLGRFASVTRSVNTSRPRWTFCVTTTVKLRFNRSLTGTKHVLQLLLSSIQFAKDLFHEGRQDLTHTYTCSACFFATLHTVHLFFVLVVVQELLPAWRRRRQQAATTAVMRSQIWMCEWPAPMRVTRREACGRSSIRTSSASIRDTCQCRSFTHYTGKKAATQLDR
jgi:hypothetical protein